MKTLRSFPAGSGRIALAAALVVLLAGCVTQRIDWTGRIGSYTLDQAVLELGPPDKEARLTDATVVAEWITRRGYRYSSVGGGCYSPYAPRYYGPFYPTYIDSYAPDYFLRLTFGPDGRLKAWKRFAK